MFRWENATCNGCLAHGKKMADNNPKIGRELKRKYEE